MLSKAHAVWLTCAGLVCAGAGGVIGETTDVVDFDHSTGTFVQRLVGLFECGVWEELW